MSPHPHPLPSVTPRRIESFVFRAAVSKPVVSTLATLSERVALLVRIEDADGAHGWGEAYATMPGHGAEYRALTVHRLIAPLVLGQAVDDPAALWRSISTRLHSLALQTGEAGPMSASLAAVDTALWDLMARKAGLPLAALLGGSPHDPRGETPASVPAYASGLNPADGPAVVDASRHAGFRAFKQKIGFGPVDLDNLAAIRRGMAPGERLMVDVNQGWTLAQALEAAPALERFDLTWVEEPLQADRPAAEWMRCRQAFGAPLAGGENLRGADFELQSQWLGVVQPDVGKWGGLSGGLAVARKALAGGLVFCPHWLGSGLGLMASAHLLAAAGGPGMLEVDVNENPLRELLARPMPPLVEGRLALPRAAGLGVEPDLRAAARWQVHRQESSA